MAAKIGTVNSETGRAFLLTSFAITMYADQAASFLPSCLLTLSVIRH
jgi:hypothetical protein